MAEIFDYSIGFLILFFAFFIYRKQARNIPDYKLFRMNIKQLSIAISIGMAIFLILIIVSVFNLNNV